ncbi:substrate-binding periplasmic protein [Paraglaciecola hydrolytica]|uniref:Solute-binding protein family 3/N-terminal domain-containing protein n=1 Tax=Paraglaciecola hydrolytica TaxID=1799789 RepID=A0A136A593_9ALTE|nr:transporter substrate-binding domain-containing protein [Paraglaciecola hydrolytica]KXI30376.1 hypothetical protein AX660_10420 [Paraglaciecola hydrolytica]
MKKLQYFASAHHLFLASVIILLYAGKGYAQEYRLLECKEIKVAGPDQWNANSSFDPTSQSHKGFAYDILQKIAQKQQIPYTVLPDLPWQRALKYAEDGQVDMIVSIYQSAERERYLEFSEPLFTNEVKIYVRKGREFNFNAFEDLKGKKGLFPAAGSYGDEFDTYAQNLDLEGKTTIADLFMYLSKGTADYAIQNENRASYYLTESGLDTKIVALANPLLNVSARLGYSRKSRCGGLLQKFKAEFQHMHATGELATLQQHSLNKN